MKKKTFVDMPRPIFFLLILIGAMTGLCVVTSLDQGKDIPLRPYEGLNVQEKALVDFVEGRWIERKDAWWLYSEPSWISSTTKQICRGLGIENSTQIECLLTDPNNQVLRYTGEPLSFEELRKK